MNVLIDYIGGFKKLRVHYSDTDSIYVSEKDFKKLEKGGFIGKGVG